MSSVPINSEQLLHSYVADISVLEAAVLEHLSVFERSARTRTNAAQLLEPHAARMARQLRALQMNGTQGNTARVTEESGASTQSSVSAATLPPITATVPVNETSRALTAIYTVLSQLVMSYNVLFASAVALGATEVAESARAHFRENARFLRELNYAMPALVVEELQHHDDRVPAEAGTRVEEALAEMWKEGR